MESIRGKFYISGGIFFALLSKIRITNKRSSRMDVNKAKTYKTCTNTSLLQELGAIIGPKYNKAIVPKTASVYKKCTGQGGLGFDNAKCHDDFNEGIQNSYTSLLNRTEAMLQKCIVNEHEKRELFVKEMYWFLSNSSSLERAQFYYLEKTYNKQNFLDIKQYDFPAFVLAVWHALIVNIPNNRIGEKTFDYFFYYSKPDTEFFLKSGLKNELPNEVTAFNTLSPEEKIIPIEPVEIKKEPQPECDEAQEEIIEETEETIDEAENIEPTNDNTKATNQRVIYMHDNSKYFENVGTVVIKNED